MAWARELAIVQAEQAHHTVGHRAHGDQGADSHVAGPKIGSRGAAPEPVGEQSTRFWEVELDCGRGTGRKRLVGDTI
jgi:hypothetical protein